MNKVFVIKGAFLKLKQHPIKRILLPLLFLLFLCGCGKKKTEIVLTTEFDKDEVFRIEQLSCMKNEVMVYLVNSENSYDALFGPEIWQAKTGGDAFSPTVEESYKETILARLAQIKALNLLASKRGIKLAEDEEQKIQAAARFYYESLNDSEWELLSVTKDDIYGMYKDYAIADKLYHSVTDDINPEISDDAARTVTIGSILVKTYRTDAYGNQVKYTAEEVKKAYERAEEIQNKLTEGTEFDVLADSYYNEDSQTEYTFGRGVMPYAMEDAAFSLSSGEISGIIKTEYGYHIIKCKSTFNKEETEKNKAVIVNKSKQDAFNTLYDEYVVTLKSNLNEPLWESISYEKTDQITTTGFFDIYDSYFTVFHDEHAPSS